METITVVDARKRVVDLLTAPIIEVDPRFTELALFLQGPYKWLHQVIITDDIQIEPETVAMRNLLLIQSVMPVIGNDGTDVRSSTSMFAVNKSGEIINVASEESIKCIGFTKHKSYLGTTISAMYHPLSFIGVKNMIKSGRYTIPQLASFLLKFNEIGSLSNPDKSDPNKSNPAKSDDERDKQPDKQKSKESYEVLDDLYNLIHQAALGISYYFTQTALRITMTLLEKLRPVQRIKITTKEKSLHVLEKSDSFIKKLSKFVDISDEYYTFGDLVRTKADLAILNDEQDEFLERMSNDKDKQTRLMQYDNEVIKLHEELGIYLLIIESKFGMAKINALTKSVKFAVFKYTLTSVNALLKLLSPAERKIVEAEFAMRMNEMSFVNTCQHVKLAMQLRNRTTKKETKEVFLKLKQFMINKPVDGWIVCRTCDRKIICSHVKETITEMDMTYDERLTKIMPFAVQVISEGARTSSYYCRICGEKLLDVDDDDSLADQLGQYGEMDIGLKTSIWGTVLECLNNVQFANIIDERQFATAAVNAIYPVFQRNEEKTIRKKHGSSFLNDRNEYVDYRIQLSIVLHCYAYMLYISKRAKNVSSSIGKTPEDAVVFILNKYKGMLSQIQDISVDYIAGKFGELYKHFSSFGSVTIKESSPEEEAATQIIFDPTYYYILFIAKARGDLPVHAAVKPQEAKKEFETVMGKSLSKILDVNRKLAIAAIKSFKPGSFVGSVNVLSNELNLYELVYKQPSLNKNNNDISKFYNVELSNREEISEVRSYESYRLFRMRLLEGITDKYMTEFKKYQDADKYYYDSTLRFRWGPTYIKRDKLVEINVVVPITILYDEDGEYHKWDEFYYTGKDIPYKGTKAIVAARMSGELVGEPTLQMDMTGDTSGKSKSLSASNASDTSMNEFIGVGCSVCHVKYNEVDSLDVVKCTAAVKKNSEFQAFKLFYETRCPEGDLHSFNDKSVCTKCGYSEVTNEYYQKYSDQYANDRKTTINFKELTTVISDLVLAESDKWTPDNSYIIKVAEFVKEPINLIEAFGFMNGRTIEEIRDGINIPEPPLSVSNPAIFMIDSEIRNITSAYSKYKIAERVSLPVIETEYEGIYKYQSTHLTANEMYIFVKEYLCKLILDIRDVNETLALSLIKQTIRNQKLQSRFGPFNWSVFEEIDGFVVDDQAGDIGEDLGEVELFDDSKADIDINDGNNEPND
jgi:hypothetical protein